MTERSPVPGVLRLRRLLFLLFLTTLPVQAQTSGAQLTKEVKPVYPETLEKSGKQGNVLLIARIDKGGRLQDVRPLATSDELFVGPAVAAVKTWQFRPARRNGQPIEIAANIGVRFRLKNERRGEIPRPMLSNLAIFPADAAGKKSGEEGFPIRRGADERLRAEAVLDVAPHDHQHVLSVRAEAYSPKGRRITLFEDSVVARPRQSEVQIPVTAKIGKDWEDGVWMLRFFVTDTDTSGGKFWDAGGGQFWLAGDPTRFDFAAAMPKK